MFLSECTLLQKDEDDYEYLYYDISETEQLPPLITTKSRILFCVVNNDVEGLKLLTDYPNLFQVADSLGFPILHLAILKDNIAVFDFLLSLDGCPLETRNKRGTTALEVALIVSVSGIDEHFAYALLKKGARFDYNSELLHHALSRDYLKVVRFLIENGVDLNCYDSVGVAPVHLFNGSSNDDEVLAMLLCFGADPSMPFRQYFKVIDNAFAINSDSLSESMQENLVFYCFDDYCTDYDITIDNLFGLLQSDYSFAPQVLKYITSVNLDQDRLSRCLETFFVKLFIIKPKYLQLLLEKFDYVIEEIIDFSLERDFSDNTHYPLSKEMFTENFDLLLQSKFSSDVIQIFNKTRFHNLIEQAKTNEMPSTELFDLFLVMLSYGANIYDFEVEYIYKTFGDCKFFRILLHMNIIITDDAEQYDIMPGVLDIHLDIETFLRSDDAIYNYSLNAVAKLLNYFVHPKLKDFCSQHEDICAKINNLPSVPLLVELARNEVREFLIRKYKIENSMQFYTLIKHLPISKVHQKIITLETQLY